MSGTSDRRLDETLRQIDELFAQSRSIASAGRGAFFGADFILRNAAIGVIVRLGEAAKSLPQEYVAVHVGVDYRGLVRMRDAVAHRYDTVDWNLVWETIESLHPHDAAAHGARAGRGADSIDVVPEDTGPRGA